jgi:hypothetical protein
MELGADVRAGRDVVGLVAQHALAGDTDVDVVLVPHHLDPGGRLGRSLQLVQLVAGLLALLQRWQHEHAGALGVQVQRQPSPRPTQLELLARQLGRQGQRHRRVLAVEITGADDHRDRFRDRRRSGGSQDGRYRETVKHPTQVCHGGGV